MKRIAGMVRSAVWRSAAACLLALALATLGGVLACSSRLALTLAQGWGEATWTGRAVRAALGALTLLPPLAVAYVAMGTLRGAERFSLLRRYVGSKIAPLFALVAVTLCTAMVIIVISVMGGFHSLMSRSMQQLSGDVIVRSGLRGFAHYEALIAALEKRPEVLAATPVIQTFGLLNLRNRVHTVEVYGVEPAGLDRVVGAVASDSKAGGYRASLYWDRARYEAERAYLRLSLGEGERLKSRLEQLEQMWVRLGSDPAGLGMSFGLPPLEAQALREATAPGGEGGRKKGRVEARVRHGLVLGIEVEPSNSRTESGTYLMSWSSSLGTRATLTVLPLTERATVLEPAVEEMVVVNEFKSGLYDIDANRVYVPFAMLQGMLNMERSEKYERFDPVTGEPVGEATVAPARASAVLVRGREGVGLERLVEVVKAERDEALKDEYAYVTTWRDQFAGLLAAVQNEKGLLTFLFGFISLVAVVMIGVIFYMIVLSKTRDIGTLRALGATRSGVIAIFLGYGLTIGSMGAGLGLALAWAIVTYLNEIHAWLADGLGTAVFAAGVAVTAGAALGVPGGALLGWRRASVRRGEMQRAAAGALRGFALLGMLGLVGALAALAAVEGLSEKLDQSIRVVIWDPRVYFFDRIPAAVDWDEVGVILIVAVATSLLGATVPAYRAGLVDPVESLRYE